MLHDLELYVWSNKKQMFIKITDEILKNTILSDTENFRFDGLYAGYLLYLVPLKKEESL